MGIKYVKGDVVEAFKRGEIDILVHGVNCQGKMNSGIAKQIRAEFPQVFKEYEGYIDWIGFTYDENDKPDRSHFLGDTLNVRIEKFRFIVNAFTQNNYGYEGNKYCSYDAIDKCMKTIKKEAIGNVVIAMPKIGAGLGGGDWKVIEAIINSVFEEREVLVYEL